MAKKNEVIDTRTHILNAGRELLLAAQGALTFCKDYVESNSKERRNPELIHFFSKALAVAEELAADFQKERGKKPHAQKRTKNH